MARIDLPDLSRRLAEDPEAVCRAYLSNGCRQGRYWIVGDVQNTSGKSLFVRLTGGTSGRGARGNWTDTATGQFGDLIDLIRLNRGHADWRETVEEARAFLRMPRPPIENQPDGSAPDTRDPVQASRRLFARAGSLHGTPAETYLAGRGLPDAVGLAALRYHPGCFYRHKDKTTTAHPALLARVTDLGGAIMGLSRTFLAPGGRGKADLPEPRRAMGDLLGNGVRFPGPEHDMLIAGEGVETVLSVRAVMPRIPTIAGLTANHLSALLFPPGLRRLYVARDNDPAGLSAYQRLLARAEAAGISDVWELVPANDDFNTDLCKLGPQGLALHLAPQLAEEDAMRFLQLAAA